jgi:hypothetical protein
MKKRGNHWLDEIAAQMNGPAEQIPEGWIPFQSVMDHYGWNKTEAKTFCDRAVAEGAMQRKKFMRRIPGQGVRSIWHYFPKK